MVKHFPPSCSDRDCDCMNQVFDATVLEATALAFFGLSFSCRRREKALHGAAFIPFLQGLRVQLSELDFFPCFSRYTALSNSTCVFGASILLQTDGKSSAWFSISSLSAGSESATRWTNFLTRLCSKQLHLRFSGFHSLADGGKKLCVV